MNPEMREKYGASKLGLFTSLPLAIKRSLGQLVSLAKITETLFLCRHVRENN